MNPKPYKSYKPSGVEWLGEVPEHWEVKRLGFLVQKIGSGKTPSGGADSYQPDGIMLIRSQNVHDDVLRLADVVFISEETNQEMLNSQVYPQDVLLNITGASLGRCCIIPKKFPRANVNQHVCIIRLTQTKVLPTFIQRVLLSASVQAQIFASENGSSRESLTFTQIADFTLALPPLFEQQAIANFLDAKTTMLDKLIVKKRLLLEKLREQRTALISQTVTKGLPEAEAKAAGLAVVSSFKPSGVEWLGKVPTHWEVKAIKWETPVFRGASPRPIDDPNYFDDEGEYAWVRIADVTASEMFLTETTQRLSSLGDSLSVRIQPGSLFLSIAGTVGQPCIAGIKCCIHDGFVYFPHWRNDTKFLFYIFASGEPYKGLGKFGTQLNLNTDTVGSICIPIPPLLEQVAIANYLERETGRIDELCSKIETALEKLKEYRAALITAAVTGRLDVREGNF